MIYKVYTLTDPLTLKVRYVGITKDTLAGRRSKHLTNARSGKHNHRTHWIRSLLQNNLKPIIEELDRADSYEELLTLEVYWISQFKTWGFSLVNATEGGEGSVGYKHTREARDKIIAKNLESKLRKGVKPKIPRLSKEDQYKLLAKALAIPVLQYSLQGDLIQEWESRLIAARANNTSSSVIGHALKDPTRVAVRSFWRYKLGDPPSKIQVTLKKGNKVRLKVECSTGEILLFDNLLSAEETLKISRPTIMKYFKSGKIYNNKYTFKKRQDDTIQRYLFK